MDRAEVFRQMRADGWTWDGDDDDDPTGHFVKDPHIPLSFGGAVEYLIAWVPPGDELRG